MLTQTQTNMVRDDFEKFISFLKSNRGNLDFELFGIYAASILNFYLGSSLIKLEEKKETCMILCKQFNAGLKNIISKEDLEEIAEAIIQDPTLDYQVLQPVFGMQ